MNPVTLTAVIITLMVIIFTMFTSVVILHLNHNHRPEGRMARNIVLLMILLMLSAVLFTGYNSMSF